MPRVIRYHPPGALVHMISSFSFGDRTFELPGARAKYLALAERAEKRTDWIPLAYALMGTHPHWALIAGTMPASTFYHSIHTGFGLWVNQIRRNSRPESAGRFVGHVFAKRPRTWSVLPQDAPRLIAYLHNNPVRAGIASNAAHSAWTSHRAYLSPAERSPWLSVPRALDLCGISDTPTGRNTFHELVASLANSDSDWFPDDAETRAARRQLRHDTNAPAGIATPSVGHDPLEWIFPAVLDPNLPTRDRWSGTVHELLGQVAQVTRVSIERMRSRSREREVCRARRIAVRAWTDFLGRRLKDVAVVLGISSAAASRYLRNSRSHPQGAELAGGVAARCWGELDSNIEGLSSKCVANKLTS